MQYLEVKKPLSNIFKKIFKADNILPSVFFIVLFYAFISFFFGEHSLKSYFKKKKEKEKLIQEINQIKLENQKLRNLISKLKTDPYIIEKKARENLGLMKENEEIFIILEEKSDKKEEEKDRWIDKIKRAYKEYYLEK